MSVSNYDNWKASNPADDALDRKATEDAALGCFLCGEPCEDPPGICAACQSESYDSAMAREHWPY